ncbi:MAG: DUF6514 family protein [Oscillospiraceae bacterium]
MTDVNIIVEKSIKFEGISLKYQIIKREDVFEGNSYTFYDISVEKNSKGVVEENVCSALTTDINTAKKVLNILCDNIVLPENLFECLEECLELVL